MDHNQELDILQGLAEAYQEIIETAKGKVGQGAPDTMKGAVAAGPGGKAAVWTPARGMGAKKAIKNDPKADDARAAKQKKQAQLDRNDHRSVTPEQRRERARKNKENKAKAGIDDLLKDIKGK